MERRTSAADVIAAGVLLVVQLVGSGVCIVLGISLVFVSDACGTTDCSDALIVTGMGITALVPALAWLVALVHVVVRARRQATVWWVPVAWGLVSGLAAVAGVAIAFAGGPDSFS